MLIVLGQLSEQHSFIKMQRKLNVKDIQQITKGDFQKKFPITWTTKGDHRVMGIEQTFLTIRPGKCRWRGLCLRGKCQKADWKIKPDSLSIFDNREMWFLKWVWLCMLRWAECIYRLTFNMLMETGKGVCWMSASCAQEPDNTSEISFTEECISTAQSADTG